MYYCLFLSEQKRKPAHDRICSLSRTSVKIHPRCHLDSRNDPCALRNTFIFPATDVCLTSQNTKRSPFPVPSAVHLTICISTRLSPSRTLCARITALISASTVYYTKLFYKLPHTYIFVKHFFQILLFTFFLIPYHPAVYFDIIPVETSS